MQRLTVRVGVGAGVGAALWAGPALLWWDPLRRVLTPGLAGVGPQGHLALTFDDGPDPASTPAVLGALERLGWRATFFMLGSMAARAPEIAGAVVAAGHEVGVHGYRHAGSLRRPPGWLVDDLRRSVDVVSEATGRSPFWYRPPFGELSSGALLASRRLGLRPVLWTAWGRDWRAEATPESVVGDLCRGTLDGGTALLHDSDCTSSPHAWKTTVACLPLLAEVLGARGLTVGPLEEHRVVGGWGLPAAPVLTQPSR